MGKVVAAISGFAMGSAATAAACYLLYQMTVAQAENKRDSFETARTLSASRSMRMGAGLSSSEQINFLSDLVNRLWIKLGPAIGETIKASVEPILKDSLPGPLSDMHFTRCDFGNVPIRFDNIVVHPIKDGCVKFDLDVVWDGSCDIQLKSKAIKLGVKNMKLFGRMQFLMNPLTDVLPCIGAIQYAFINTPTLELDFTGLANFADLGGIDQKIKGVVNGILDSLMVLPNRMTYKMDLACDYRDAFVPPLGVARITAVSGRGFQIEKTGLSTDIPDVYLKVKVGSNPEWKTSVQKNNVSPVWNERADFLLSDTDQIVQIHAWDEDTGVLDSDDDLGMTRITVADILLARGKTLEVELLDAQNVGTGSFITLHCDVCSLKNDTKILAAPPPPNIVAGLLTVMVTKAFDLQVSKEEAESFVKVKYGGQEFLTGVIYDYPEYDYLDGQNPVYDISFLVPITRELMEKGLGDVEFELMNGYAKPTSLGSLKISHQDLLDAEDSTIKDSRVIGTEPTKLEFFLSLQSIDESKLSSPVALSTSTRSLGVLSSGDEQEGQDMVASGEVGEEAQQPAKVKVTVVSGKGFKIKKKKFKKNDVPDVYCTVKFGSSPKVWRTSTIKDHITPVWDESETYLLANENQVISLDAWDSNSRGDDDYYGSFRVAVGKVLLNAGTLELELQNEGKPLGYFITIACELE